MALDPSEIEAIARAVAAYASIGTGLGLLFAVICGILVALKITVPFGAKMVEAKMLDPKGAVQTARKAELAAFEASIDTKLTAMKFPGTAAMEAKVDGVIGWMNGATPLLNNLTSDNLLTLMNTAIKNNYTAGKARGDGGGGAPTALEGALDDAEWALGNPEQASALAVAHQTIDSLIPVFNWNEAKVKQLHAQANAAKGNVEGLQRLMEMLQRFQGGGTAGGGQGGKSGPGQF